MAQSAIPKIDFPPEALIPGASLESILGTDDLRKRPWRSPDYKKENRALVALAGALTDEPHTILQTLAETIRRPPSPTPPASVWSRRMGSGSIGRPSADCGDHIPAAEPRATLATYPKVLCSGLHRGQLGCCDGVLRVHSEFISGSRVVH
jgi:hypothetical protein